VLNIPATLGIVGLVFNLILLASVFAELWHGRKRKEVQVVLVILACVLLHGLAEPIFESGFMALNIISLMFWMLAGFGMRSLAKYRPAVARVGANRGPVRNEHQASARA
jgi:apolipoprotein N-acyltransferase